MSTAAYTYANIKANAELDAKFDELSLNDVSEVELQNVVEPQPLDLIDPTTDTVATSSPTPVQEFTPAPKPVTRTPPAEPEKEPPPESTVGAALRGVIAPLKGVIDTTFDKVKEAIPTAPTEQAEPVVEDRINSAVKSFVAAEPPLVPVADTPTKEAVDTTPVPVQDPADENYAPVLWSTMDDQDAYLLLSETQRLMKVGDTKKADVNFGSLVNYFAMQEAVSNSEEFHVSIQDQVDNGAVAKYKQQIALKLQQQISGDKIRPQILYTSGFMPFADALSNMVGLDAFPSIRPSWQANAAAGGALALTGTYAMGAALGRIPLLASLIAPMTPAGATAASAIGAIEGVATPSINEWIDKNPETAPYWRGAQVLANMIVLGGAENAVEYGINKTARAIKMSSWANSLNLFGGSKSMVAAIKAKDAMFGDLSNPDHMELRKEIIQSLANSGKYDRESIENLAMEYAKINVAPMASYKSPGRQVSTATSVDARGRIERLRRDFDSSLRGEKGSKYLGDVETTAKAVVESMLDETSPFYRMLGTHDVQLTPGVTLSDMASSDPARHAEVIQKLTNLVVTADNPGEKAFYEAILRFDGIPVLPGDGKVDFMGAIDNQLSLSSAMNNLSDDGVLPELRRLKGDPVKGSDTAQFAAFIAHNTVEALYKGASDTLFHGYLMSEYGLNSSINPIMHDLVTDQAQAMHFQYQVALARKTDPTVYLDVIVPDSVKTYADKFRAGDTELMSQAEFMSVAEQQVMDRMASRLQPNPESAYANVVQTGYQSSITIGPKFGHEAITINRARVFNDTPDDIKVTSPRLFEPRNMLDIDGVRSSAERLLHTATKSKEVVPGHPDEKLIRLGQIFNILEDPDLEYTAVATRDASARALNTINDLPLAERQAIGRPSFSLIETFGPGVPNTTAGNIVAAAKELSTSPTGEVDVKLILPPGAPPRIQKVLKEYVADEARSARNDSPASWAPDASGKSQIDEALLQEVYDTTEVVDVTNIPEVIASLRSVNDPELAGVIDKLSQGKGYQVLDKAEQGLVLDHFSSTRAHLEDTSIEEAVDLVDKKIAKEGATPELTNLLDLLRMERRSQVSGSPGKGRPTGQDSVQKSRLREIDQWLKKTRGPEKPEDTARRQIVEQGSIDKVYSWVDSLSVEPETRIAVKAYVDSLVSSSEYQGLDSAVARANWVSTKMNEFAPAAVGEAPQVSKLLKMLDLKDRNTRASILSNPHDPEFKTNKASVEQAINKLPEEDQKVARSLLGRISSEYEENLLSQPNPLNGKFATRGKYNALPEIEYRTYSAEEMKAAAEAFEKMHRGGNQNLGIAVSQRERGEAISPDLTSPDGVPLEDTILAFEAFKDAVAKEAKGRARGDETFSPLDSAFTNGILRADRMLTAEQERLAVSPYAPDVNNLRLAFGDTINNTNTFANSMYALEGAQQKQFFDAYKQATLDQRVQGPLTPENISQAEDEAVAMYESLIKNTPNIDKAESRGFLQDIRFSPTSGKVEIPAELQTLGQLDTRSLVASGGVDELGDEFSTVLQSQITLRVRHIMEAAGLKGTLPEASSGEVPTDLNILQTSPNENSAFLKVADKLASMTPAASRGWIGKAKKVMIDPRVPVHKSITPARAKALYTMHERAMRHLETTLGRLDLDVQSVQSITPGNAISVSMKNDGRLTDILMAQKALLNIRGLQDTLEFGSIRPDTLKAIQLYEFDMRSANNLINSVMTMAKAQFPDVASPMGLSPASTKDLDMYSRGLALLRYQITDGDKTGVKNSVRQLASGALDRSSVVRSNMVEQANIQLAKDLEEMSAVPDVPMTRSTPRQPDEDNGIFEQDY